MLKLVRKNGNEESMRTPETISTLNTLIHTCRDAESLCGAWGGSAASAHMRYRLRNRSEEWGRQGDELQALVLLLGGEPATRPTLTARLQRVWVALRMGIVGCSDTSAADGSERIAQQALVCYERALAGYLPERIRRTVGMQAQQIFARCDRMVESRAYVVS